MDSSMRVYAVAMGSWSQQHLKIEQLFARFDSLPGFTEEDVQQRIDRLSSLKIDFNVEPLASGEIFLLCNEPESNKDQNSER